MKKFISQEETCILGILTGTFLGCGIFSLISEGKTGTLKFSAVFTALALTVLFIRLFFRSTCDKLSERAGLKFRRCFLIVGIVLLRLSPLTLITQIASPHLLTFMTWLSAAYFLIVVLSVFVIVISFDGAKESVGLKRASLRTNAVILEVAECVTALVCFVLAYVYQRNANTDLGYVCRTVLLSSTIINTMGGLFFIPALAVMNARLFPSGEEKRRQVRWLVFSIVSFIVNVLLWFFCGGMVVLVTGGV